MNTCRHQALENRAVMKAIGWQAPLTKADKEGGHATEGTGPGKMSDATYKAYTKARAACDAALKLGKAIFQKTLYDNIYEKAMYEKIMYDKLGKASYE